MPKQQVIIQFVVDYKLGEVEPYSLSINGLTTSVLVAGCGNGEKASTTKESNKGMADKQVLNLLETAEIPSMDTSKSTDSVSFRVFVNAMEGLYRLDKDNKPTPGMAKDVKISEDKRHIHLNYVMRNGQMVIQFEHKILYMHGNVH